MTTSSEPAPIWLDGNGKIDEVGFCECFRESHPMLCIHETFFTRDGKVTDESRLKSEIYQMIKPYVRTGVSKKVNNLLEALRSECFSPPLPIYHDRIHVANGTLFLDGYFEESKDFCLNRLPVRYDPDAPRPERWLRFLEELLIPEDILTLKEFMGYCLIPSTKAQKMLMLVGKGGEGKSRVGIVLSALLGINMYSKVETSPFARADLEYGLLMVDDDMKMEALPDTNILKTLITAELPMDLEKKGKQSYQGTMYVRFIGFGNGALKSRYDRSVGFFRRQIILTVKDKPAVRVDDPFLSEKLITEIDSIFLWALEGLRRLMGNDFRFTLSDRSRENMRESVSEGNNVTEFLKSEGYIGFKADFDITSQRLYEPCAGIPPGEHQQPLCQRPPRPGLCGHLRADPMTYERTENFKSMLRIHERQLVSFRGAFSRDYSFSQKMPRYRPVLSLHRACGNRESTTPNSGAISKGMKSPTKHKSSMAAPKPPHRDRTNQSKERRFTL